MKNISVDVAVIGHGTSGANAYRSVIAQGKTALTIEGGVYGTTCARVGCMPSKLFIAAADACYEISEAKNLGITASNIEINGKVVMKRVREMRDFFVGFVLQGVESVPESHKIKGYARFEDDHTLLVDDHTRITADRIVIATGSRPLIPDFLQGKRIIHNDELFDMEDLPSSVAVFGVGVIGLELGQALSRLGVKTTLFGRSGRVGPLTSPDLVMQTRDIFKEELDLVAKPEILSLEQNEKTSLITYKDDLGKQYKSEYEHILCVPGRISNTDRLSLENTSLICDEKGVPKYDHLTMQCEGAAHIFIAGDATADLPLLHEATDEGKKAGLNAALFPNLQQKIPKTPLSIVFSDPQIMSVGKSFRSLKKEKVDFVVGTVDFSQQGRARIIQKNKGGLEVYFDKKTKKFLGAEMIGPRAEHFAHLLSWMISLDADIDTLLEMPFYHPVLEEGLRTTLQDAHLKLLQ